MTMVEIVLIIIALICCASSSIWLVWDLYQQLKNYEKFTDKDE